MKILLSRNRAAAVTFVIPWMASGVEVVASTSSGCSEIEMRGSIKHAPRPGSHHPASRDPTQHG